MRFYGIYSVNIEGVSSINLVLMENSLSDLEDLGGAKRIYDLKGSLVNRYVRLSSNM